LQKNGTNVSTDRGNPYTPFTQRVKRSKGEPFNRVTLADDGDLYNSMQALVTKNQLELVANFDDSKYDKGIFVNFQSTFSNKTEFRETVMSLTNEEIEKIVENLLSEVIKEMKKEI